MAQELRYTRPNYRQLNTCANCVHGSIWKWFDGSEDTICTYDRVIKNDLLNESLDLVVDPSFTCDNHRKLGIEVATQRKKEYEI